jgi:hypothetical protein
MKKMKLRKLLCCSVVVPALLLAGCKKDEDPGVSELQYTEVDKVETVQFLNQVKESESFDIEGYSFNVTMAMPKDLFGIGDTSDDNELWPDISNDEEWEKIYMNGSIFTIEEIEAKYTMKAGESTTNVYIKDSAIYLNSAEGNFKMTYDSESELQATDFTSSLPSTESLMQQIDMVIEAPTGLKFEKAENDGNIYHHIYGEVSISEEEGSFSVDMEMPIDLYLTFKDNKLVGYKYKTFMLFVYMEIEISESTEAIEFPTDLNTYIENEDAFFE